LQCPGCSAQVSEGSKFCGQCGTALPHSCPNCGHSVPAGNRFCSECGTSLVGKTAAQAQSKADRTSPATATGSAAERRQLTIMFCDMVGSSALSTRLDPEEQGDVIAAFHACCATEVKALGGMVAQYLGDGVLAYFGYPTAHENDAERAILAGLAILKAITSLKPTADVAVQARIAIGSGVVVVGDLVRQGVTQENAAIGETTNLVARLQTIAEPNSLVISPLTHRLVGALFDYRDLGRHTLKGFPEPVHVRQVLGVSKVESRFEAQHQSGASPLLGRTEELGFLLRQWDQAKHGEGRVVLMTGEPGIGKSRIARAFQDRISLDPHTVLSYFCSSHHQASAYYPHITQLTRAAGIERDDSAEIRLDKLHSLLGKSSNNPDEEMPLIAALLSIPGGHHHPLPKMTPQRRKERTLVALLNQLKCLAAHQPVLVVYEDLHWIDPISLELLSLTIEQVRDQRILMLAIARPEFSAPWRHHRHVSTLSLNRFGVSESEALIGGITKGKAFPSEVLSQIVARTDGVPLFIEELTKTVLESGKLRETDSHYELTGPLPALVIPSTLHASLLARLDRLGSVKDLAQIGATIGREFSYALIAAVAALPERDLKAALGQLIDAELILQRGLPPHATYAFKHALVQDTSYASMVRSRRQQLHGQIAEATKALFPEVEKTEPETLARHYQEAGSLERAIEYWAAAGDFAESRSAGQEAARHYRSALSMLPQLGRHSDWREVALDLNFKLGNVLSQFEGFTSRERRECYGRARELASETTNIDKYVRSALLMAMSVYPMGRFREALAIIDQIGDEHLEASTPATKVHYFIAAGIPRLLMGQFAESLASFDRAIMLDNHAPCTHLRPYAGADPAIFARTFALAATAPMGNFRRANKLADEAHSIALERGHKPTIVLAMLMDCRRLFLMTKFEQLIDRASKMLQLARSFDFKHREGQALTYLGCSRVMLGEEGVEALRNGHELWLNHGGKFFASQHAAETAAALVERGHVDEARRFVGLGEQIQASTDECWYQAELLRIRARLTELQPERSADAVRIYRDAIGVADEQGATLFKLRAATGLARCFQFVGRAQEAKLLLRPVIGEITNAFDNPDIKHANTVLKQLSE
jgi:class 3 adenylate cyclase/tetratricopeptide (TPR) repeat protein